MIPQLSTNKGQKQKSEVELLFFAYFRLQLKSTMFCSTSLFADIEVSKRFVEKLLSLHLSLQMFEKLAPGIFH